MDPTNWSCAPDYETTYQLYSHCFSYWGENSKRNYQSGVKDQALTDPLKENDSDVLKEIQKIEQN